MALRSRALIALGFVLVTVPVWGPVADVTGSDYVYRTAAVTVDGDEVVMNTTGHVSGPTDRIACMSAEATLDYDRHCYLESRLRNGSVVVDYPGISRFSGDPRVRGPDYVVFGPVGQPYRRTVAYNDSRAAFVLGLEPVAPERALADAARTYDSAPDPVQRAIRTGSARTDEPIRGHPATLYERPDDGYTVVYSHRRASLLSAEPGAERVLEAVAVVLGALVLYDAGRRG